MSFTPTNKTIEKVIRDGKVAILYSPWYWAWWYTWNYEHKELIFHPKLVQMVENNKQNEIDDEWLKENLWLEWIYCWWVSDLQIEWIEEWARFRIDDYDWSESVINLYTDESVMTA